MTCPNCGESNPADALFCGGCGQKLEKQKSTAHFVGQSIKPKTVKKGNPVIALVAAMFIMGVGAMVFFIADESPEESDAISMLENSFAGGYSGAQIQDSMDKAMVLYGVEQSNENYIMCGAVLTALRFENEKEEMEILSEMLNAYESGKNDSFEEAAREAARALSH